MNLFLQKVLPDASNCPTGKANRHFPAHITCRAALAASRAGGRWTGTLLDRNHPQLLDVHPPFPSTRCLRPAPTPVSGFPLHNEAPILHRLRPTLVEPSFCKSLSPKKVE